MTDVNRLIAIGTCVSAALAGGCTMTGDSAWNGAHISAGAGYQQVGLAGEVDTFEEIAPGVIATTEFDFEDNGGQDDAEPTPYLVAQAGFAPLELRGSAFRFRSEATGTFTGDFLGTDFVTGTVETDYDIDVYQLSLGFDLVNIERFRLAALAGASLLDIDIAVRDGGAPGTEESIDEVVPVPLVGARGDLKVIGSLRIGATALFFPVDEVEGFETEMLDLEGAIAWAPLRSFEIFGLYRYVAIEAEGEVEDVDAALDLRLGGPVVGVALTF
jgi:hypothetical protein